MNDPENKNAVNDNLSTLSEGLGLIFLIGFMGSGKTTLGRKLAARLGYEFMDLDHVLEEQAGMSIAQYFSRFGEDAFREYECEILRQTVFPARAVIATGGGLPCYFNNIQWLNTKGKTVYIKLSPKSLAGRLESEKNHRPLLHEKRGEDLVAFIAEKLTEREVFYGQAHIIADGLSLTAEKLEGILNQ